MIGPHYQLMAAASAIATQMQNAKGAELRALAIARRHTLAGARLLAPDNEAHDRITAMLEQPLEGRRCPRCLAVLPGDALSHYCKVECDACGEPKPSDARGWVMFNPDKPRHVCAACVKAGYLEACQS
jgi:hypothetical protein